MDAKSDIFVNTLKLMAAYISGFTVYKVAYSSVVGHACIFQCMAIIGATMLHVIISPILSFCRGI